MQSTTTCSNHVYLGEESFSLDYTVQVKLRGGLDAHADSNDRHAGTAPTRYVKRPGMGVRALVFDVIELLVGSLCTGFQVRTYLPLV